MSASVASSSSSPLLVVTGAAAAGAPVSVSPLPAASLAPSAGPSVEEVFASSEALGTDALLPVAVSAGNGPSVSVHGAGPVALMAASVELDGGDVAVVLVLPLGHLGRVALSPALILLVEGVLLPVLVPPSASHLPSHLSSHLSTSHLHSHLPPHVSSPTALHSLLPPRISLGSVAPVLLSSLTTPHQQNLQPGSFWNPLNLLTSLWITIQSQTHDTYGRLVIGSDLAHCITIRLVDHGLRSLAGLDLQIRPGCSYPGLRSPVLPDLPGIPALRALPGIPGLHVLPALPSCCRRLSCCWSPYVSCSSCRRTCPSGTSCKASRC